MKRRVALFFGSFNPVHIGHLVLGEFALQYGKFDALWYVVSPQNPFKEKHQLLPERQRLHMVHLAIADMENMWASDIEFDLPKPSFTVHTLAHLQEKHPTTEFSLIMGEDNASFLHKWKNYEVILENYPIWVYPRLHEDTKPPMPEVDAKLNRFPAPRIEISSSFIRNSIQNAFLPKSILHPKVREYIDEMLFYKEDSKKK